MVACLKSIRRSPPRIINTPIFLFVLVTTLVLNYCVSNNILLPVALATKATITKATRIASATHKHVKNAAQNRILEDNNGDVTGFDTSIEEIADVADNTMIRSDPNSSIAPLLNTVGGSRPGEISSIQENNHMKTKTPTMYPSPIVFTVPSRRPHVDIPSTANKIVSSSALTNMDPTSPTSSISSDIKSKKKEVLPCRGKSQPLNNDYSYCGQAGSECPAGYNCDVHPFDKWAVCCSITVEKATSSNKKQAKGNEVLFSDVAPAPTNSPTSAALIVGLSSFKPTLVPPIIQSSILKPIVSTGNKESSRSSRESSNITESLPTGWTEISDAIIETSDPSSIPIEAPAAAALLATTKATSITRSKVSMAPSAFSTSTQPNTASPIKTSEPSPAPTKVAAAPTSISSFKPSVSSNSKQPRSTNPIETSEPSPGPTGAAAPPTSIPSFKPRVPSTNTQPRSTSPTETSGPSSSLTGATTAPTNIPNLKLSVLSTSTHPSTTVPIRTSGPSPAPTKAASKTAPSFNSSVLSTSTQASIKGSTLRPTEDTKTRDSTPLGQPSSGTFQILTPLPTVAVTEDAGPSSQPPTSGIHLFATNTISNTKTGPRMPLPRIPIRSFGLRFSPTSEDMFASTSLMENVISKFCKDYLVEEKGQTVDSVILTVDRVQYEQDASRHMRASVSAATSTANHQDEEETSQSRKLPVADTTDAERGGSGTVRRRQKREKSNPIIKGSRPLKKRKGDRLPLRTYQEQHRYDEEDEIYQNSGETFILFNGSVVLSSSEEFINKPNTQPVFIFKKLYTIFEDDSVRASLLQLLQEESVMQSIEAIEIWNEEEGIQEPQERLPNDKLGYDLGPGMASNITDATAEKPTPITKTDEFTVSSVVDSAKAEETTSAPNVILIMACIGTALTVLVAGFVLHKKRNHRQMGSHLLKETDYDDFINPNDPSGAEKRAKRSMRRINKLSVSTSLNKNDGFVPMGHYDDNSHYDESQADMTTTPNSMNTAQTERSESPMGSPSLQFSSPSCVEDPHEFLLRIDDISVIPNNDESSCVVSTSICEMAFDDNRNNAEGGGDVGMEVSSEFAPKGSGTNSRSGAGLPSCFKTTKTRNGKVDFKPKPQNLNNSSRTISPPAAAPTPPKGLWKQRLARKSPPRTNAESFFESTVTEFDKDGAVYLQPIEDEEDEEELRENTITPKEANVDKATKAAATHAQVSNMLRFDEEHQGTETEPIRRSNFLPKYSRINAKQGQVTPKQSRLPRNLAKPDLSRETTPVISNGSTKTPRTVTPEKKQTQLKQESTSKDDRTEGNDHHDLNTIVAMGVEAYYEEHCSKEKEGVNGTENDRGRGTTKKVRAIAGYARMSLKKRQKQSKSSPTVSFHGEETRTVPSTDLGPAPPMGRHGSAASTVFSSITHDQNFGGYWHSSTKSFAEEDDHDVDVVD